MFFRTRQPQPEQRQKRCSYECACGNRWSIILEFGDRATKRGCRCKQPCHPSATTHTVRANRSSNHR
jgi:hypothetical protein